MNTDTIQKKKTTEQGFQVPASGGMKILRITSFGYVGGGVENGILLLQPVLEDMGHTVKTLSSDHNSLVKHFSDYEFRALSSQPGILKLLYRAWYPHSFFALRKVLKEYQPDVVQVHSLFEVSASVLFLLRKYPTVLTVHGAEDYTKELLLWAFPLHFFKKKNDFSIKNLTFFGYAHYLYHRCISIPVFHVGFRNVDVFVSFSEYMQRILKKEGFESVCIPNGTDLFEPSPIHAKQKNILFVGRLEKIKGVQTILEALPNIIKKHPSVTYTIAGTGEYEKVLKQMVHQRGLSRAVTFVGHKSRNELYKEYKKSTIVVVPSIWPEPFGKVGIEAMSVGRPVIASDVGGISDWLEDGKSGFLVQPGDVQAFVEKIDTLLSDTKLLEKMSQEAVHQSEKFSIQKHADKIVNIYESVLKQK